MTDTRPSRTLLTLFSRRYEMFTAMFILVVLLFPQIDGGDAATEARSTWSAHAPTCLRQQRGGPCIQYQKVALTAAAGSAALRHRRLRQQLGRSGASSSSPAAARGSSVPQLSLSQTQQQLLRHGHAQAARRRGQGQRRGDPAGHRVLHPVRRVRRAVPEGGVHRGRAHQRRTTPCRTRSAATRPSSATRRRPSPRAPACWSSTRSTPGVGAHIESYAKAHGVAVIDYDRLTLGGTRKYYVSFNNVQVGKLIGPGPGQLRRRLGREEAAGHRHEGRADRQQRDAVRAGLRRGARAAVQLAAGRTSATRPAPGTRRPR